MIKTFSLVLDLLKVCLCVKLESSVPQDILCKSARLDRSKIRLDRSKLMQIVFLQNFLTQPKYKRKNSSLIFMVVAVVVYAVYVNLL